MSIKKVVVCTDLEGVSGVTSFAEQTVTGGRYYEQARKLLTAEVNAAVEGMIAEGLDDILVLDGHGAGGICFEELHPAAQLLHGRPLPLVEVGDRLFRAYDAAAMIGQHAMSGTPDGNLNHTQCSATVECFKLNGRLIGEIAQFALFCGELGVPLIFLSGDRAACREAEELVDGITTAIVKEGLNRTCAVSLAPTTAHRRIHDGIRAALRKQTQSPLAPLRWPGPYVLEKRFLLAETAEGAEKGPLCERVDAVSVRYRSDDLLKIIY